MSYFKWSATPFLVLQSNKSQCIYKLGIVNASRMTKCLRNHGRTKGEGGLVDRKLVKAPRNFIAGRPKATLLFWFFSDFRCGVPLFIVILVIYKYKNRYK